MKETEGILNQRNYRMSPEKKQIFKEEILELENNDIIEKTTSL